ANGRALRPGGASRRAASRRAVAHEAMAFPSRGTASARGCVLRDDGPQWPAPSAAPRHRSGGHARRGMLGDGAGPKRASIAARRAGWARSQSTSARTRVGVVVPTGGDPRPRTRETAGVLRFGASILVSLLAPVV